MSQRAEGAFAGLTWVQSWPSKSQVSPKAAVSLPPPNSTIAPMRGRNAIAPLRRGDGARLVVTRDQSEPSYSQVSSRLTLLVWVDVQPPNITVRPRSLS